MNRERISADPVDAMEEALVLIQGAIRANDGSEFTLARIARAMQRSASIALTTDLQIACGIAVMLCCVDAQRTQRLLRQCLTRWAQVAQIERESWPPEAA